MSRALLLVAVALVTLPGTAAAQMPNDMLYSDHVDRVRFHGIRREATLQGEQLVLSLDLFTYRNDSTNHVVVAIHANNGAGRDVPPAGGSAPLTRDQWTRREYVIVRSDLPQVRIWIRESGMDSIPVKSWTFEELRRMTPALPELKADVVGVVREASATNPRYRLRLKLTNTRGPAGVPFLITRAASLGSNDGGYAMTRLSGPDSIRVGGDAEFEYELREDPAYPRVLVRAPTGETIADWKVSDLVARAQDPFTPGDLASLAGRYRTWIGTLMTFHHADGLLYGSSQTVGARPQPAESIQLRPGPDGKLAGDMFGYVDGRRVLDAPMTFDAGSRSPLRGRYGDPRERRDYLACPVAENDYGPWDDPRIRIGLAFWARLDEVRVTPTQEGRYRALEVKLTVWSLAGAPQPALWAGTGTEPKQMMGQVAGFGGEPLGAARMPPCATTTMFFRTTGQLRDIDSVMLEGTLSGLRYTKPWDVAAEMAKIPVSSPPPPPPSPAPMPSPAPSAPAVPAGSPLANTGPSRPTAGGTAAAGSVPVGTEIYSNYGIWDFRIEELKPGPDGHWQALLWVRDAASYPVGMAPGQVTLVLIDEDGRMLRSDPLLYRASVTGPSTGLQLIPQTLWMEKGDEIRLRIVFHNSAGFEPTRFRIAGGGHDPLSRTFNFR